MLRSPSFFNTCNAHARLRFGAGEFGVSCCSYLELVLLCRIIRRRCHELPCIQKWANTARQIFCARLRRGDWRASSQRDKYLSRSPHHATEPDAESTTSAANVSHRQASHLSPGAECFCRPPEPDELDRENLMGQSLHSNALSCCVLHPPHADDRHAWNMCWCGTIGHLGRSGS